MAGAGYKVFNAGDILTSSDVNTYLQQQVVMVFNDAAARTTALTSVLAEGMVTYLKDTNTVEVYDGSAWVSTTGDITGITAGTGITVTNPTSATPTVSIDTAVVPRLANANTFTTGAQTIQTGGTGNVGLIVQAHLAGGQTANLQEWKDSSGNNLVGIGGTGGIFINRSVGSATTALIMNTGATTNVGIRVDGVASQTANLQEWRDSSGNVLSSINSNGHFNGIQATLNQNNAGAIVLRVRGAASQSADLQQWQDSAGGIIAKLTATPRFVVGSTDLSSTFSVVGHATGGVTMAVRGVASQTANLQEWQDSSGNILARVTPSGAILNGGLSGVTTMMGTIANAATTIGIIIRAAASQTANLQEWQNNSGTVLSRVASNGDIHSNAFLAPYLRAGGATVTNATALQVNGYGTSVPTVVVRAIASQTANLQEWQNSAGTVNAYVNSGGSLFAISLNTSTTGFQAGVFNSGGYARIEKATASATTGSTTAAQLFVVNGTNANTLKLVIRSNGAETTIVDNIPTT